MPGLVSAQTSAGAQRMVTRRIMPVAHHGCLTR